MSRPLGELSKIIIADSAVEDCGLNELVDYYAMELTPVQRTEIGRSLHRVLHRVIEHTLLLADGSPSDVMDIFNAGIAQGFDEGVKFTMEQLRKEE